MYTILADDDLLYVPDDQNYCVSSASISINSDGTSYLDLDIPDTNKTVSKLVSGQTIVRVYWDDELKYKFYVESVSDNLEKTWEVSCNSVKTFLSDTLVRPYSTLSSDGLLVAPSSMNGYFQWLIDEHNNKVTDDNRRFLVGFNGGSFLDRNNYIYRSSTEYPTTESEIEDKILSPYSAYLELTFQNDQNIINLYSDVHETNSQIVELGNTLLDLSSTNSVEDMYTAVIPFGATDDDGNTLTIYSYQDGITKYDPDIVKKGDHIYSKSAVAKYGYKECVYNNSDISVQENLVDRSVKYLKSLMSPVISVDAKAIDQSFLDPDSYAFLKVNQAVRVRSSAHNIDEYFKVCSMTLDLLNPESSNYVFGNEYNTYTGQQSAYLAKLNLSINSNFDIIGSAADAANKVSEAAKEAAEKAAQDALDAQNRAEEAKKNAEEAEAKADEANTKSDEANAKVDAATEKINTAISDAKDAADKASEASKKADEATAKTEVIEKSLTEISGNTDQAIANAQKAQDAADAAKKAADDAQASANESATEIGKVKSQVETINTEIADVKSDATKLRDDLSGQITTVKNTMEADYSRKSDLTETTETLRNEISESAAGVLRTVSTDYATKSELKTTTDATNKNAQDLTTAIKKFDGDINSLQGQIDGSIQTWFYEVVPTDQNEPAVNWTTTDLKNVHLGDLYYDTITGYCYRYQVQNNVYSWQRITDVDVTKALSDAAKAQDTADHKRRVFVSTPTTPYDVGDLWVQGTNGDIMRCQVAKTSSQTYAEADWVKASKYTDDTATNTLSNYVEKTYSTKSEVKQLSDTVSSTVSSLETVKTNAEAAQTSANNAKAAADAAQAAADTAKANAATAQSTADAAKKNLETAQKNLETLQSQANATDADLATAKANVEKAQKAADAAQTAADTAKTNASTAQATADAAKTAASNAQKDVDSLKDRVTKAETSITQNADAIALRATKTEVTSAINDISVGGRNIILDTGSFIAQSTSGNCPSYAFLGSLTGDVYNGTSVRKLVIPSSGTVGYEWNVLGCKPGELYTFSFWVKGTCGKIRSYFYGPGSYIGAKTISWSSQRTGWVYTYYGDGNCDFSVSESWQRVWVVYELNPSGTGSDKYILIRTDPSTAGKDLYLAGAKLEKGNKATDWSPAPEDLESDATTKANNALTSAKSYTDARLKVTSESITSTVSKTYATQASLNTTNSNVTKAQTTADSAKSAASNAQTTANNAATIANSKGIDYSQGKMLYTDPSFASGTNSAYVYNNINNGNVTVTRTSKSSDNPMTETSYELTIANTGTSSPGCGGFYFANTVRANAIFIYRIIAKIPTGYNIKMGFNPIGDNASIDWLTSTSGTGAFREYILKLVCGSIGTFVNAGYFYIDGSVGTTSAPVKWYVAYATCFDMTNVGDALTANNTANSVKNDLANNYSTTVQMTSAIEQSANSITSTVSKTYQTKSDMSNYATNSSVKNTLRSYTFAAASGNTNHWTHIGDWTSSDAHSCHIIVYSGNGYNAGTYQNSSVDIFIKDGWQSTTSTTSAYAATVTLDNATESEAKVKVIATAYNKCQVWLYTSWSYAIGYYTIDCNPNSTWTNVSTSQSAEPTGASQSVAYRPNAGDNATQITSVKQTVDGLTTTISTVKSTADAAKTSTNTLETLIRQSGNGVEVAKKVNGSYTSTKTLMGSDGFYVQDASGNTLSSFGKDTIELGKNSANAVIKLCGDNAQIKTEPREGGRSTSIFADGGGIGISTSSSNAYSRINAYAGSSSSSGNPTVSYLESATYDGSSNKTIQRLDSHGFSLSVTGGSYINTLSMDHTGLQFAKSTGTSDVISGYINDFVVAQGSSGDWTYRKWASGKAEAWLKFTHTTGTFYLWNSTSYVWYGANIVPSRAYPFTFQTIRNEYAFVTNTAHSVFLVPGGLNSGQTDQYYVVSVTSADAGSSFSVGINIYTVGTWK